MTESRDRLRLNLLLDLLCTDDHTELYRLFVDAPFKGAYPTKHEMLTALDHRIKKERTVG